MSTLTTHRYVSARLSRIASATILCGLLVAGAVNLSSAGASTSTLPKIPTRSLGGALKSDTVIIPVTMGTGTKKLRAFTARKTTVYVQFACSGPGGVKVTDMFTVASCKAKPSVFGYSFSVPKAWAYHPTVTTSRTTKWEIRISSGPKTP